MRRKILIEVEVEEIDVLEEGYGYNPKVLYEITPTSPELRGESIELVCRRSEIHGKLNAMDKTGMASSNGRLSTDRAIYEEPSKEVSSLLRDAAHKILGGFSAPAIDAIIDSVEEAVMPSRKRTESNNRGPGD